MFVFVSGFVRVCVLVPIDQLLWVAGKNSCATSGPNQVPLLLKHIRTPCLQHVHLHHTRHALEVLDT